MSPAKFSVLGDSLWVAHSLREGISPDAGGQTMSKIMACMSFAVLILGASDVATAHPGRTAADGCHYCRTNCDKWGGTSDTATTNPTNSLLRSGWPTQRRMNPSWRGPTTIVSTRTCSPGRAQELIAAGTCKASDFQEMGGWVKSSDRGSKPVYFTYCGGMRIQNRLYLNAATGEIFR